jgi:hypothetical protein
VAEIPSEEELHARWLAKLTRPQGAILRLLLERYPAALSREEIAAHLGIRASTGSFNGNLTVLRSLGLVAYPREGHAAATALLFPVSAAREARVVSW